MITGQETEEQLKDLLKDIRKNRQIILAIHDNRSRPRSESDLNAVTKDFIDKLAGRRTVTAMFTNPYAIDNLPVGRSNSIIVGYQNDAFMQKAVLKVLLGQIKSQGKLSVTINKDFKTGSGL